MTRTVAALGCVLAGTAAMAPAQFRSSVSTVAVYATVGDAQGRLVPDLRGEDFTILDNGVQTDITLFSSDPQPITVAIMLDTSGSMARRFMKVRQSTLWFINALAPGDRAQIGTFGEEIAVSPLLTGDKQVLTRVIEEELWPLGPTPLWNAADQAMTALAREAGRRVVLMLTDGADSCNYPDCVRFRAVERRAAREGFMFYAIAMDSRGIGGELVALTERTGGGHFELKADDNMTAQFARVAEELRHQYLLGFAPASLDGKEHRLEVRLNREGMRVRARDSYLAVREP
jgi:Ca-activated chloride channel family protein